MALLCAAVMDRCITSIASIAKHEGFPWVPKLMCFNISDGNKALLKTLVTNLYMKNPKTVY